MSTRRSARLSAATGLKSAAAVSPPPSAPKAAAQKGRKRKAEPETLQNGDVSEETATPAPTTPNKRRAPKKSAALPPTTPTPGNVMLMAEGVPPTVTSKPRPAAVARLADPRGTNATLLSPETSRIVAPGTAAAAADIGASPSKAAASDRQTKTTTATLLEEANRHLIAVDARMKPLVDQNYCRVFSPEGLGERIDPFESLCSGIISQQVSGAAAKAIKKRFVGLFSSASPEADPDDGDDASQRGGEHRHRFPHPSQVAGTPLDRLRTAGLSQRKAEYVQGLAQKFVAGELSTRLLAEADDEELVSRLTAVRGLGRWSVEMFACFALKRMDVFSLGDLGVQRGMAAFVGRDVARLKKAKGGSSKWRYMSEAEMVEISDRFRPYRSLFMWYMWRVEETDVSTME
ncbi:DNA glycosylase [Xylariomycetidae sp. FL2044]|nr:DNA glycosylase [Xylariomycetidae sp. FL2044]